MVEYPMDRESKEHCLIVGGTGFVGTALVDELLRLGWRVTLLSRTAGPAQSGCTRVQSLAAINTPVDAVVNLAGASLAGQRWSPRYKQEIIDSRLDSLENILDWIAQQPSPPKALVQASAIGYYGHQEGELDERCGPGQGFSSELCQAIEARLSSEPATTVIRLGVVLERAGGALPELAATFRFGIASYLGDGQQMLSWIHRHDAVSAIIFLVSNQMTGVYNLTAPKPVSHRELTCALQKRFDTYLSVKVPGVLARALIGEMADDLLLNGQTVLPRRLLREGFRFTYPELDTALAAVYPATR